MNDSDLNDNDDLSFLKTKSIKPNQLKPGNLVCINNPQFPNDVGQIIDINRNSGKILLKLIPRINYRDIRLFKMETQSALNNISSPDSNIPLNFFNSEILTSNQKQSKVKISWVENGQIDCIKWDGGKYIGKFLYKKFLISEIFASKIRSKKIFLFKSNLNDFEKKDKCFMENFKSFEEIGMMKEINLIKEKVINMMKEIKIMIRDFGDLILIFV